MTQHNKAPARDVLLAVQYELAWIHNMIESGESIDIKSTTMRLKDMHTIVTNAIAQADVVGQGEGAVDMSELPEPFRERYERRAGLLNKVTARYNELYDTVWMYLQGDIMSGELQRRFNLLEVHPEQEVAKPPPQQPTPDDGGVDGLDDNGFGRVPTQQPQADAGALLTGTERLQAYASLDDDGFRLDKYGKLIAERQLAKAEPIIRADERKRVLDLVESQWYRFYLEKYDGNKRQARQEAQNRVEEIISAVSP